MAVLYLGVGVLSGIAFFVALAVIGSIVLGLTFTGVGLLLVGVNFRIVDRFAARERAMARWIGVDIEPRPMRPITGIGLRSITDPERWREVGFVALNIVIANVLGVAGLGAFWIVPRLVFSDPFANSWLFGLGPVVWAVGLVLAAVILGAAPRIAVFVARFKAQVTAWFLGPDQLAAAEQRVSALSDQRQDILDAVATERRRIERNLHDGVQQQLVAIGLDLSMAEQHVEGDPSRARELLGNARQKVQGSIGELRQLGRGLHPAILDDRGIDAALSAVVSGSPIPISVHVDPGLDLSTDVAETVYFVANEAIANVLKHAAARVASVHVSKVAANVRITVHDDGRGGVDPTKGTGIAGIRARVNAVDGSLDITSPHGGPTTLVAEIPRHDRRRRE
jgi:signal transduction histidine kinase